MLILKAYSEITLTEKSTSNTEANFAGQNTTSRILRRFRRRRSVKGSKAAASTEEIVAEVEDEPAEDEDEDLEAELAEFKKTR